MKKRLPDVLLLILILLMVTGCSTALNLSELGQKKIYGGVRQSTAEMCYMEKSFCSKIELDELGGKFLSFLDLPFSLIGDTLTLPITIPSYFEKPVFYRLHSHKENYLVLERKLTKAKECEDIIKNRKVRYEAYNALIQIIDDLLEYHKTYEDYQLMVRKTFLKYHDIIGCEFGEVFVEGLKKSPLKIKDRIELIRVCYQPTAFPISAAVYQYSKELGVNDFCAEYEIQQEVIELAGAFLQAQNKSQGDISSLYRQNRYDDRYWSVFFNKYSFGYEHALIVDTVDRHVSPVVPVRGDPQ